MDAYQHEQPVVHEVAQQAVPEHLWLVGELAKGLFLFLAHLLLVLGLQLFVVGVGEGRGRAVR